MNKEQYLDKLIYLAYLNENSYITHEEYLILVELDSIDEIKQWMQQKSQDTKQK